MPLAAPGSAISSERRHHAVHACVNSAEWVPQPILLLRDVHPQLEPHAPKQLVTAALIACHFANLIPEIRSGLTMKSFSLRISQPFFSLSFALLMCSHPAITPSFYGAQCGRPNGCCNRSVAGPLSNPKVRASRSGSFLGQLCRCSYRVWLLLLALMGAFVFGHTCFSHRKLGSGESRGTSPATMTRRA